MVLGVNLDGDCAARFNKAFDQYPTPQMLTSPAGIYYNGASREISLKVAVSLVKYLDHAFSIFLSPFLCKTN